MKAPLVHTRYAPAAAAPPTEGVAMQYDVQLGSDSRPRPLAVVRRLARPREIFAVVRESCGTVWNVLRALKVTGAGRHVAIYLDCEINLEVGVELDAAFAGSGEVVGSEIPAGDYATTVHFGPYGQLHVAHEAVRDWTASRGYELAGPNWEVYGHWEEAWNSDPSRIRTDVFYLLAAL